MKRIFLYLKTKKKRVTLIGVYEAALAPLEQSKQRKVYIKIVKLRKLEYLNK